MSNPLMKSGKLKVAVAAASPRGYNSRVGASQGGGRDSVPTGRTTRHMHSHQRHGGMDNGGVTKGEGLIGVSCRHHRRQRRARP